MNRKFLGQDIKRSVFNLGFAAGICGLGALLAKNFFTESVGAGSFYYAVVNIMAASGFSVFVPIFPVLGYSSWFCREYESGYYRFILARTSVNEYALTRIVSVALSGGLIVGIPMFLVCFASLGTGLPEVTDTIHTRVDVDVTIMQIAQAYGPGMVVAAKTLLSFLFGAAWALVGLSFAVWMPNQYVALIAPFVLYECLYILPFGGFFAPGLLVLGDHYGHLYSAVMECGWILLAAGAAMAGFLRRCKDA